MCRLTSNFSYNKSYDHRLTDKTPGKIPNVRFELILALIRVLHNLKIFSQILYI